MPRCLTLTLAKRQHTAWPNVSIHYPGELERSLSQSDECTVTATKLLQHVVYSAQASLVTRRKR
jgi:hypothetical protein